MAGVLSPESPSSVDVPCIDDEPHFEEIDGQLVETPRMGREENAIAAALEFEFRLWNRPRRGWIFKDELVQLKPGLRRRPDLAFLPFWRHGGPRIGSGDTWQVVPTLTVEVVSPSNTANDIQAKIEEYFAHGVELVWVIYPQQEKVYVYTDPNTVTVVTRDGHLDGAAVLPGFRVAVARLFEELTAPPEAIES